MSFVPLTNSELSSIGSSKTLLHRPFVIAKILLELCMDNKSNDLSDCLIGKGSETIKLSALEEIIVRHNIRDLELIADAWRQPSIIDNSVLDRTIGGQGGRWLPTFEGSLRLTRDIDLIGSVYPLRPDGEPSDKPPRFPQPGSQRSAELDQAYLRWSWARMGFDSYESD